MKTIDRRGLVGAIPCGAGASYGPRAAGPRGHPDRHEGPGRGFDNFVQKAQTVMVHNGRRRRRRWVCWWHGAVANAVGAGCKTQKRIGATAPRLMPRTYERGDVAAPLAGERASGARSS